MTEIIEEGCSSMIPASIGGICCVLHNLATTVDSRLYEEKGGTHHWGACNNFPLSRFSGDRSLCCYTKQSVDDNQSKSRSIGVPTSRARIGNTKEMPKPVFGHWRLNLVPKSCREGSWHSGW